MRTITRLRIAEAIIDAVQAIVQVMKDDTMSPFTKELAAWLIIEGLRRVTVPDIIANDRIVEPADRGELIPIGKGVRYDPQ